MMNFLLLNFNIHALKIIPQMGLEQNLEKNKSKWFGISAFELFNTSDWKASQVSHTWRAFPAQEQRRLSCDSLFTTIQNVPYSVHDRVSLLKYFWHRLTALNQHSKDYPWICMAWKPKPVSSQSTLFPHAQNSPLPSLLFSCTLRKLLKRML